MNFHQNPSILTNVFKSQISPMRRPSISGGPKCLKYQNVPYIRNFWHIMRPWNRFQCWVRIIYFLTVPDDHTVAFDSADIAFISHQWVWSCSSREQTNLVRLIKLNQVHLVKDWIAHGLLQCLLHCEVATIFATLPGCHNGSYIALVLQWLL